MRVVMPDWTALGLFAAIILAVTLYGLALSGHFPSEHRAPSLRSPMGLALLWGTSAVAVAAGIVAVHFAAGHLPVYASVIAGGLAVLVAPLCLNPLPDSFVDGRGGLVALAAIAGLLSVTVLAIW
jgi:hypothetical protein